MNYRVKYTLEYTDCFVVNVECKYTKRMNVGSKLVILWEHFLIQTVI